MPKGVPNTIEGIRARLRRYEHGHLICHVWPECKNREYGRVGYQGKTRNVHKALWEAKHGPVPDGLELDHLCRNHMCANTDHLEAVPHHENVRRGRVGKHGKHRRGSERSDTKFDEWGACGVMAQTLLNIPASQIGKSFGVSDSTVWCIRDGKNWAWLFYPKAD